MATIKIWSKKDEGEEVIVIDVIVNIVSLKDINNV